MGGPQVGSVISARQSGVCSTAAHTLGVWRHIPAETFSAF